VWTCNLIKRHPASGPVSGCPISPHLGAKAAKFPPTPPPSGLYGSRVPHPSTGADHVRGGHWVRRSALPAAHGGTRPFIPSCRPPEVWSAPRTIAPSRPHNPTPEEPLGRVLKKKLPRGRWGPGEEGDADYVFQSKCSVKKIIIQRHVWVSRCHSFLRGWPCGADVRPAVRGPRGDRGPRRGVANIPSRGSFYVPLYFGSPGTPPSGEGVQDSNRWDYLIRAYKS